MDLELVSVIIPVYKVEPYLDKCVETVLRQSYSNIEVWLIDDGSPDSCGLLCDHWAEKDRRIRVIHKENGGLADARNTGLDAANGDYIVFVDSDDYVASDMVEKLYKALKAGDADMSICNFLHVYENGDPVPDLCDARPIGDEVITGQEAIIKMHTPEKGRWIGWYYSMAWNKLYKKELFSEIRYPKGKLCEDVFIAHWLFGKCNRIACISDVCYYYLRRTGRITYGRNYKTNLHDAEGYLDRALYCYDHGLYRAAGHAFWESSILLADAYPTGELGREIQDEYEETLRCFRQNIRCRKYCTAKEALQISIVNVNPALYRSIFRNSMRITMKRALRNLKWAFKK